MWLTPSRWSEELTESSAGFERTGFAVPELGIKANVSSRSEGRSRSRMHSAENLARCHSSWGVGASPKTVVAASQKDLFDLQLLGVVSSEHHVSTNRRWFVATQGCFYFIQHSLVDCSAVVRVRNSATAALPDLKKMPRLRREGAGDKVGRMNLVGSLPLWAR